MRRRFAPLPPPALLAGLALLFAVGSLHGQNALQPASETSSLTVSKIDPPNWYAGLPEPMLLMRGTGFTGASFLLSDRTLHVQRASISANGHWAQLYLDKSPATPETVQITVTRGTQHVAAPYTFAPRRAANDGMAGFSAKDVLYLILTDRFADGDLTNDGLDATQNADSALAHAERAKPRGWHGGDIRGVLQHLDYLQQLGVTAVWLTPVYTNAEPEAYHGYHATDYFGVDPHLGSLADLQTLARTLHSRGMRLVLDTVPNHVGPGHPWVTDEPAANWFHGTAAHHLESESNFDALINPHAPARDRTATLDGWFVNTLPDMNTDDPAVAQYLRQNAVWWLEQTGADALRIDTFPYVNREFWQGFTAELQRFFPHVTEVGEVSNRDPEVTSAFASGVTRAGVDTGLYTPFDFPLYYATRDVFGKGAPFTGLSRVLESDALYPHPERLVPFLGNHDTSRLAEVVRDPAMRKLAFGFLMTTRGMPQIYAGDEIAMSGGDDPEDRHDFPGGSPAMPGTSVANAFSATGRTPDQQAMYSWVQGLAKLRHDHPALACGAEQVLASGPDLLAYTRFGDAGCPDGSSRATSEKVLVVLERGALSPVHIELKDTALADCAVGETLAGEGEALRAGDDLNLRPKTPLFIVTCR